MYRFIIILSKIRNNRNVLIASAAAVVFAVCMMAAFAQLHQLHDEVDTYTAQIASLNEKVTNDEAALKDSEGLSAQVESLKTENATLGEKNTELSATNTTLAGQNDELERQNGDLSKKFSGLSKPN